MKKYLLYIILVFSTFGLNAQIYRGNSPLKSSQAAYAVAHAPALTPAGYANDQGSGLDTCIFYAFDVCGLNYVYGSVMTETRSIADGWNTNGTGFPATINISGIPSTCTVILQAYLFMDASCTETTPPKPTVTITNPAAAVSTTGAIITGTGPAKCWGEKGTVSYRVDVTSSISGNGNYIISPTGFANASSEVDGCTLMIIYQTGPTTGTTGTLFLFDGAAVENSYDSYLEGLYDLRNDSIYGLDVCANSTSAQTFFITADQTDDAAAYTTNTETGNAGHSAMPTTETFPNNQWNFNSIATSVTSGQGTTSYYNYRNDDPTYNAGDPFDCYNWVVLGMYYQTNGCVDCLPVVTTALTYPACNGDNGTAIATVSNGTSPYTYTWSNGATTSSQLALSAGDYTITIEDAICNTTQTIIDITQPTPLIGGTSSTGVLCNGGATGTATGTSTGGTSPYTYSWSPAEGTKSTATGLTAGTYTITVKDKHGCIETAAITVTQPAAIELSTTYTDATCSVLGSATVSASGGTAPYTYAWTLTGGNAATANGLSAGNYTITVHDNNDCEQTATVTITQPTPIALSTTFTDATCSALGSATVSASGGIVPYTYDWNPTAQNTANATGLTAGNYTITVSSGGGCSTTASVTITQASTLNASTSSTPASCGLNNGTATISVIGGTLPYTYEWNPSGQTTATATGLGLGTYTVITIANNGCSATTTVVVTQPTTVTATMGAPTNPLCNGETGSATVTATGGTLPYTYAWTGGAGAAATATITAGTYTVTVTTNTGCTSTASVVITQPALLTASMGAPTNPLCNGETGSATVTATGGTLPYIYAWTGGGGAAATATVPAGNYTVTVTDANGCTSTASVDITQPALLTATMGAPTDPACNGGTGSATVSATGGTVPYTYAWTPSGGSAATATGLAIGTYTATITDNHGCASSVTVTITQPTAITTTTSFTPASCNLANGSATVTPNNGTVPYTYAWGTAPVQTTATAGGISAGTYSVVVTDNHGCSVTTSVTVTQPSAVTATITALTYPLCNGGTGTATVTATGGTLPYTYGWDPTLQTTATANGLSAGTYTVAVSDNNGCVSTTTAVITQPILLTATTSMTQATCGNSNGTATVTASGGTGAYNYTWNPPVGNTATVNGLSADTYTVTVTDANGCTATSSIIVTSTPPITISTTVVNNVSCFGGDNGSATANGAGGTGPYQYGWLTTPPQLTQTANGLSAGTYSVGTEDANGCTATTTVTITQPTALSTTTSFTQASCNLFNGSATVTPAGGTGPYAYDWGIAPPQTTATALGVSAGTYTVLVTDANGCTITASVTVTQPSAVTAYMCGSTGISCNGGDNGTATACASGGTGPYGYTWSGPGGDDATGTGFSAGTYTVTVHDINGCISTASVTITQPAAITVNITGPGLICAGSTATLTANVAGGTMPYAYNWSGVGLTASASNTADVTPPGSETYTVVITDANGCTATAEFTTTAGPPVFVTATGASICPGGSATICANATGGTGGTDIFTWQPGNYSSPCITVSPNLTTVYTVTVVDNCGTTATATATVQMNPYPVVNFSADLYQGCVPLCIQFYNNSTLTSGAAQSFSWLFGNGDSSNVSNALYCYPSSGIFSVSLTVVSDSGCSATLKKSQIITVYPAPVAAFTMSPQPTTILSPTIQFTNTSTGAYPITYWFWNFGDGSSDTVSNITQNPTHTYADTGTYCAQLATMDEHGCTDTTTNCLIIEPIFTLYIPSAFTPNGGGLNETFMAKGVYVKTFSMDIFDRWGEHLYHTDDINAGWNGTAKGGSTVCQEDIYVYKILATDMENNQHSYIGSVTLIK
jgi:large repetitive protein